MVFSRKVIAGLALTVAIFAIGAGVGIALSDRDSTENRKVQKKVHEERFD